MFKYAHYVKVVRNDTPHNSGILKNNHKNH